jgi:hypothetical protein
MAVSIPSKGVQFWNVDLTCIDLYGTKHLLVRTICRMLTHAEFSASPESHEKHCENYPTDLDRRISKDQFNFVEISTSVPATPSLSSEDIERLS